MSRLHRPVLADRADPAVWEVARPSRSAGMPGTTMAGFGIPAGGPIRIVPHPAVMVVLVFGAGTASLDDVAGRHRLGSFAAAPGFGSGAVVRAHGSRVECLQVRLSPVTASTVLGVPAAALAGAVPLHDLWGAAVPVIEERLARAPSWTERFGLVEALLSDRASTGPPVDPGVGWARRRIVTEHGRGRVEAVATELGWSRARLWARFRSHLGMGPKRAASLVRFDHAAHRLVAGHSPARVAAEGGYADQSHLHR